MNTQHLIITRQIIVIFISLLFTCLQMNKCVAGDTRSARAFAQIRDGSSHAGEIDLNGKWQFKATDEEDWMDAFVPSTVWSDLLRVGRVEDPFYRDNELKVQWVERKEWEYVRSFNVDLDFLKHDKIILDCRGLDTITEIYLNDSLLAQTQNMFVEYEFEVKKILKARLNKIHIIFRSVLEWDKKQVEADTNVIWTSSKERTFFLAKRHRILDGTGVYVW